MSQHPKGRLGSFTRLRGLIRKEFLQIIRDPSSIGIAFVLPVVLLLLFGYGISLDAERVPVAVVVENPGGDTADFVQSFAGSQYFVVTRLPNMAEAERALMEGQVNGIIHLRADFSRRTHSGQAAVQVILDGADSNTARIISGYVEGVWQNWLIKKGINSGAPIAQPVEVEQRIWFNSELRSRDFLVPGLLATIMTLIGALLTAMVMAREWERGTMEALMVTPVRMREVLLGKLIPYFILGMGGMAVTVLMAVFLFDVPLRGSILTLTAAGALFLLVALGMGLLISAVTRDQFLAGQTAIVTTFLPAFILSGFIFDIDSMPVVVRLITRIIAARYFVAILHTVFLAGDIWPVILPNALALTIMAVIFLGLTRAKSQKRLM